MFPPELKEFLHLNPYPSLSFLPMLNPTTNKEELFFFLQHEKQLLETLLGRILVKIDFYEEKEAYIMKLETFTNVITKVDTTYGSQTTMQMDFPYFETEFHKNKKAHIEALKLLLKQNDFSLILYDRYSNFFNSKKISFTNKIPLRNLLKKNNLI